jgi:hypothetical protein
VLGFNEPPLTDFASAIAIEVRDAAGANIVTDPVSIVDSTLTVSVAPTAQGAYTVLWQRVHLRRARGGAHAHDRARHRTRHCGRHWAGWRHVGTHAGGVCGTR